MPSISEKEFHKLKHAVDELSALNQIASAINVSMSVDKITRIIVDHCLKKVGATQGAIFLLDEGDVSADKFKTFIREIDPDTEQIPFRLNISLTGWMIKNKAILLSNDPQNDDRFSGLDFSHIGVNSILSAPLLSRKGMIGVLALFNKSDTAGFSDMDKRFAGIVATQTAKVIENARLFEKEKKLVLMEEEMKMAKSIQKGFLPRDNIICETYEICGYNYPARDMGGDYFDIVEIDTGQYFISLGDVSGKGMPAALLMANAQAVLRSQLTRANETMLPGIARCLNHLICQFTSDSQYITAIFGIFNPEKMTFKYINAGHLPPMIVRKNGTVDMPVDSDLVIGVLPEITYRVQDIKLEKGETLCLYTDGITEAENNAQDQFEEDRLKDGLLNCRDKKATDIGEFVLNELTQFRGDAEQSDDITVVMIKTG